MAEEITSVDEYIVCKHCKTPPIIGDRWECTVDDTKIYDVCYGCLPKGGLDKQMEWTYQPNGSDANVYAGTFTGPTGAQMNFGDKGTYFISSFGDKLCEMVFVSPSPLPLPLP